MFELPPEALRIGDWPGLTGDDVNPEFNDAVGGPLPGDDLTGPSA